MLYVRGNIGDTDDVFPELDGDILYTVLSFKAAPRWLCHDGMRRDRWRDAGLSPNIYFSKNNRLNCSEGL